jgi:hypothetical protein
MARYKKSGAPRHSSSSRAITNSPPAHLLQTISSVEAQLRELLQAHLLQTISSVEPQLRELLPHKAKISRRIAGVKSMLNGIASLFGASVLGDELPATLARLTPGRRSGFTLACRQVLMESPSPLRTLQVCEQLQQKFPDLVAHHKDLGASVTTIFHRLVKYGEARCAVDEQGVRVWQWAMDRNGDSRSLASDDEGRASTVEH